MRVTPANIREQSFTVRFRGFDPQEVDAFLDDVAEDLEAALKENAQLREQLAATEERTRGISEREKLLQETLVTTHRLAEEMKEAARRELDMHLREGELQREKLLEAARTEEADPQRVQTLKRTRRQLVEELRATSIPTSGGSPTRWGSRRRPTEP
jgi:cell division initiation protein